MGRTRGGTGRQIDASGRRDARDERARRAFAARAVSGAATLRGDRDGRGTTTGRAVGGFGFLSRGGFGASERGGWGEMGTETHPHAANSAPRVNVTSAKPSMKDKSGAAPLRADIAGSGEHARGHAARTNAIDEGRSRGVQQPTKNERSGGPGGVSDRPEICSWKSMRLVIHTQKYFSFVDLFRLCELKSFSSPGGEGRRAAEAQPRAPGGAANVDRPSNDTNDG